MAPDPNRVSFTQLQKELALRPGGVRRQLRRVAWAYPKGPDGKYDARIVDFIHALHGRPHRELLPPERGWLAVYLKEIHEHTSTPPGNPAAGPDRDRGPGDRD